MKEYMKEKCTDRVAAEYVERLADHRGGGIGAALRPFPTRRPNTGEAGDMQLLSVGVKDNKVAKTIRVTVRLLTWLRERVLARRKSAEPNQSFESALRRME